jgi:YD repeat-containing protein
MMHSRNALSSLKSRWQSLARRWTAPIRVAWDDLWERIGIHERTDRKRSTLLDIERLEIRELPAFALNLLANAAPDPFQSPLEAVRRVGINLHDGNAQLAIPIDIYRSDSGSPTALVYDSNTTNVKPVLQFEVTSDGGDVVPTSIVGTLTFNGSANSAVTFTTTGHSAGDDYLIALQHGTQITSSGYYSWSVAVTVNRSGLDPVNLSGSGSMEIVVRDTSSDYFGRGWSLAGFDKLVIGGSGVLYVYGGTGGARYFTGTSGTHTSPANDFGVLVKNVDNSYTYTDPQQNKKNFDSSGNMTSAVDSHGLPVTYTYASSKLSTIATPDGAVTTFTYDGSGLLQTIVQPGSRTITFAHASGNDITTATNPVSLPEMLSVLAA